MLPDIDTDTKLIQARMRAQIARAIRKANREGTAERREQVRVLRAEYAAEKLADYIARTVATAPELSSSQRDRLAVLLRPTDGAAA